MRKILLTATALLIIASVLTSCGRGDIKGFRKTNSGLNYNFHVKTNSPKAQLGEIIIGEIWMYAGDELLFTNEGNPMPLFQVGDLMYDGAMKDSLLLEALLMIGVGDSVTFAYNLNMLRENNPHIWGERDEDFIFHTIKVERVYTEDEFEIWMAGEQIRAEAEEAAKLAVFISEQGITAKPNADGVYVIVERRGTGAQATRGKTIGINYIGRLVDGTVFDTSFETVAREEGLFAPGRPYEPLAFPVGAGNVIPGMDNALVDMRVGTKARLIIPSNVGYGGHAVPGIPAFSTLIFDIEVVSVR